MNARYKDISKQVQQEILQNVQVGGNLTVGSITQLVSQAAIKLNNSPKPLGIPQNLPHSGTIKFVGREQELARLHEQLQQTDRVAISAIAGMGGIGKTELALQYAQLHWHLQTYPGGICWLRAQDADLGVQVVEFAKSQLGLQPPEDWDLQSQINYCWRHWREGYVLVVLDDVRDYQQVEPYLPPSELRFKILITTRLRGLSKPVEQLPLNVLDETASLELLISFVGDSRIQRELDQAKELCTQLGCLPLGLELVGRYLAHKQDLSLAEVRQRLQERRLEEQSLQNPAAGMTAKLAITAAFEWSWQDLDDQAQQLGCLLSLFALAPIPWSLVEQCLPEQDSEDLEDLREDVLSTLR